MSLHSPVLRALACLLPLQSAFAAQTQVIVTVDVESLEGLPLPVQLETDCDDGQPCGLDAISGMLEARGLEGTFYLNVYEHAAWGEALLSDVARSLHRAGHDVALHTHPQWAYDPARVLMREYTLEEQTRIVGDGLQLLQTWIDAPVVSHRAGAYGADANTLRALAANGIRLDSSYFAGHDGPRLDALSLPSNVPARVDEVVEIPVTVYERAEHPWPFGGALPPHRSTRKIDPDWFADEREAVDALDRLAQARLPYVVVFLHSFSMISSPGSGDGKLVADRHTEAIFAALLDRAAELGLPVVTMRDLADAPFAEFADSARVQDVVPTVPLSTSPARYAWHSLDRAPGGATAAAATLGSLSLVCLAGVAGLAVRRRSTRRRELADG